MREVTKIIGGNISMSEEQAKLTLEVSVGGTTKPAGELRERAMEVVINNNNSTTNETATARGNNASAWVKASGMNGTESASDSNNETQSRARSRRRRNLRAAPQEEQRAAAPRNTGDSLVHVSMLYHKRFGAMTRKAPAHMPHMIDRDVMATLQEAYPEEFEATSSRRFRGSSDMQFALSYFYWLIHNEVEPDLEVLWNRYLDTDGDGRLSDNELRTLAAIVAGKAPTKAEVKEIWNCLRPEVIRKHISETEEGTVHTERRIRPHATFGNLVECARAVEGLKKNTRKRETHRTMPLTEVTFEMIGDDFNKTMEQLDGMSKGNKVHVRQ